MRALLTGSFPTFVLRTAPRELGSEDPVFCYHLVGWQEFERDLKFLSRNDYTTINAQVLLDHLTGVGRLPDRSFLRSTTARRTSSTWPFRYSSVIG